MNKKVALSTMGCRANQFDSSAMAGLLARGGWELVDFNSPADAYILNTCTVTNKADQEARQLVRRAHRQNPEATILVTGCYAQTDAQALAKVEGVSFILGNDQKGSILDHLERVQPLVPEIIVRDLFQEDKIFTSEFNSFTERARAYLKIQDGCNQMCSYCVIPFARGMNRSLSPEKVIEEMKHLASQGFEECVLTGIHIGTYGRDLDAPTTLLELMRRIEEENPIHRVRLSSIDPEEVSDEMVEFLSRSKVFCQYLHIPLQSGNDQILKLMRRRYTAGDFHHLAVRLKDRMPQICLGTDVMAGFPYEDEERFESSYRLVEQAPLDYLHVFPYSPKKRTRAAAFLNQVSPSVKKERVRRLTELSRAKREEFYRRSVGSRAEIVIEETVLEYFLEYVKGTSRNYIPVYVPSLSLRGAKRCGNPVENNLSQRDRRASLRSARDDKNEVRGRVVPVQINRYEGGHVFGEVIPR